MKQNILETLIGLIVIIVAFLFLTHFYNTTSSKIQGRYNLTARFSSVEGIVPGSDVSIGGIIIGNVESMNLDRDYNVVLDIAINNDVRIPEDSRVSVVSSGLLGDKYLSITPGGDEDLLKQGDEIKYTQSSVNLESLIGKFMFSGSGAN